MEFTLKIRDASFPFLSLSLRVRPRARLAQILDGAIQTRWKILPQDQRDGIKTYVVGKIIQVCLHCCVLPVFMCDLMMGIETGNASQTDGL